GAGCSTEPPVAGPGDGPGRRRPAAVQGVRPVLLLFGAGLAVFGERAAGRGAGPTRFLARRLLVLFALGLCHLLLVWNGDILTLYAVCGLLMLPLHRLGAGPPPPPGGAGGLPPSVFPC